MPTAPTNPEIETAKPAPQIVTWLGETDASEATEENEAQKWKPLQITRRAGSQMDYAVFAYDMGRDGARLVDDTVKVRTSQIQVRMLDEDDEPTGQALFWGVTAKRSVEITPRNEAQTMMARIDPHHFGNLFTAYKVYDPLDSAVTDIDQDITFNPQVDGVIEGNMSSRTTTTDAGTEWKLWISPESVRLTPAQTLQGATASEWTMTDAVLSLCSLLNPQEVYITNPTREDLETIFDAADPPNPFNVRLQRGKYLPQLLDEFLEPYGFGWYVRLGFDDAGAMTRTIALYQRGIGDSKQLYLQEPGERLDMAKTTLLEFGSECSIADIANVITGQGSQQEREVTIELYRGWPTSEDTLSPDQLDRTYPGSDFVFHRNAWRLWVANEAGDYTNLRTAIDPNPIPGPLDLSSVFDQWVPRRRKIEDCLTRDANYRRLPVFIEWFDHSETDTSLQWKPLEPGSVSILNDQIGIYFSGPTPPSYIVAQDYYARIRITGTVQGDSRLSVRKTRRETSVNKLPIELFLDLSDRFHDRSVQETGDYASVLAGSTFGADERDDETTMDEFVTKVRDTEDVANLQATITLHGLNFEYEIGQVLNKIEGRRITLDRLSKTDPDERFMQIVGIQYDLQRQRTQLMVESAVSRPFVMDSRYGGI